MSTAIKLVIVLILFSLVNCNQNNKDKEKIETNRIISSLINGLAHPPPPPPPLNSSDSEAASYLDSIKRLIASNDLFNKRFILALDTLMKPTSRIEIKNQLKEFNLLSERILTLQDTVIINQSSIDYSKNIDIIAIEDALSSEDFWKKADLKISFSRIAFNNSFSQALMVVYVSRGRLNGYSMLVRLNKTASNQWVIEKSKLLELS